ncbi:MAG: pseudouridine-5'-phosphate glycosidase [Pseudomonadota bacterium]
MTTHPLLAISEEVADALSEGRGVVALESTILAHGLPYPDNLKLNDEMEQDVRAAGAVPALVMLAGGRVIIGPSADLLEQLAKGGLSVAKVSPRDYGSVLASGALGATTVAGTVRAAAMAGISVFATGAIGGVHRGAELSFDISADLKAMASDPVTVVSAGAKSILDLPKTLEVLESLGVPVLGYGTDIFPAFYTRDSGLPLEHSYTDVTGLSAALASHKATNASVGALVVNPIPEADALDAEEERSLIGAALAEAESQGITGKASTPFVLGHLHANSGGRTVAANVALVRSNARLAGALSVALAKSEPTT